MARTYADYGAD